MTIEKGKANGVSIRSLFAFVEWHSDWLLVCFMTTFTIICGSSSTLFAVFTGVVLEQAFKSDIYTSEKREAIKHALLNSGTLAIVGFGLLPFYFGGFALWMNFAERQAVRARNVLLQSYLKKPLAWYDSSGNLEGEYNQINRSVEEFRKGLSFAAASLLVDLSKIVMLTAVSFYNSWKLTLGMIVIVPVMLLVSFLFGRKMNLYVKLENREASIASGILDWNIEAAQMVRLYGTHTIEYNSFDLVLKKCERNFIRFCLVVSLNSGLLKILGLLMFVQGIYIGRGLIKNDKLDVKQVITCFFACLLLSNAVIDTLDQVIAVRKGAIAAREILSFVDLDEKLGGTSTKETHKEYEIYRLPAAVQPPIFPKSIEFNNITFSYPTRPNEPVLRNVSVKLHPNIITFLVGKSGSGKSTLSSLLLKFYQDYQGVIKLDEYDLRDITQQQILKNVTLVEQKCTLFDGTIYENLIISAKEENKNLQRIEQACKMACLEDVIKVLPGGLHTRIGANGVSLSGGQQQRLAFARAILMDTPVLILDEAFSALDITLRERLMTVVRDWRKGNTTIIVTHDMSHITDRDYLYMMDNHEVVDHGYKEDLLNGGSGKFSALCKIQDKIFSNNEAKISNDAGIADNIAQRHEEKARQDRLGDSHKSGEDLEIVLTYDELLKSEDKSSEGYFGGTRRIIEEASPYKNDHYRAKGSKKVLNIFNRKKVKNPKLMSAWKIMTHMKSDVKKRYLIPGLFCGILTTWFMLTFGYAFSKLLQGLSFKDKKEDSTGPSLSFSKWTFVTVSLAILNGLVLFANIFLLDIASESWIQLLRRKVMRCISFNELQWFSLGCNRSSVLTTLVMNDLNDLRTFVSGMLSTLSSLIFMSILGISASLICAPFMSMIVVALLPVFIGAILMYNHTLQTTEEGYKNLVSDIESRIFEVITSMKTVRCLRLEQHFSRKYQDLLGHLHKTSRKRAAATAFGSGFMNALTLTFTAVLYFLTLESLISKRYAIANVFQAFTQLLITLSFCAALVLEMPGFNRGKRAATNVFRIINEKTNKDTDTEGLHINNPNNALIFKDSLIEFKNLSFAYPSAEDVKVYKSINLSISCGEKVGLVGGSGCGKSTLTLLLTGLYKVDRNSIFIDGIDICDWDIKVLRKHIAVVEQKPRFFGGTIRDNIIYGFDVAPPDSDIISVLDEVGLSDFIGSLPDGIYTRIDNNLISGGQAQRISIARALIRRPSILILDECTSAIDAANAFQVAKLIESLSGTTVIMVTHSKQMMQICDKLFYIQDGEVQEEGSFDDLLDMKRGFFELVNSEFN